MIKSAFRRAPALVQLRRLLLQVASPKGIAAFIRSGLDFTKEIGTWKRITQGMAPDSEERVVWFMALPSVWGYKLEGLLTLILRSRGYKPVFIDFDYYFWRRRFQREMGSGNFIDWWRFLAAEKNSDIYPQINQGDDLDVLLALKFQGVDIGRIALSNFLYKNKFDRFDLNASTMEQLNEMLMQSSSNVLRAQELLKRYGKPEKLVLIEKGVSPQAEIFGVCLEAGVDVIQYTNAQTMNGFIFRRITPHNYQQHPFSLSQETWSQLKQNHSIATESEAIPSDIKRGYELGLWFNRKELTSGKRYKTKEEVSEILGLDPSKKTAVIFSHVLWDATFFYGENVFRDYETWLIETVRLAVQNTAVNWIIKLHPDLVWKLKFEKYEGELRDIRLLEQVLGKLPEHIKTVMPDTEISTLSFFEVSDYCLTVRGTIGVEMACFGIPVITAGTGRYSGLGFTIDSEDQESYCKRLASIQEIQPMSKRQVNTARRFAHILFNVRPWELRSFESVIHPSLDATGKIGSNVFPRIGSVEEFQAAKDLQDLGNWLESDKEDFVTNDEMNGLVRK